MFFSPDGTKLVGTRIKTSLIDSFVVGSDGLDGGSRFAIAANGSLVVTTAFPHTAGLGATDARLAPDGWPAGLRAGTPAQKSHITASTRLPPSDA